MLVKILWSWTRLITPMINEVQIISLINLFVFINNRELLFLMMNDTRHTTSETLPTLSRPVMESVGGEGGGQYRSWQVVKQFMTLWLWQGTNKLSRTRALISWDGSAELRPTNLISSRTISHLCFYCLAVPRFKRRCYYCLAVWVGWIGLCFTLSSPTRKREINNLTLSGY